MEDKARMLGNANARYGVSGIFGLRSFPLESVLPQAASAPSVRSWLFIMTLTTAVAAAPACVNEQDSAIDPGAAVEAAPKAIGNPKLAEYSQVPEVRKIDLSLLRLERKVRSENSSLRQGAQSIGIIVIDDGVMLDIVTNDIQPDDRDKFQLRGVDVHDFSPKYNRVSVIIRDLDQVHALAALPEVRSIAPEYGAETRGGSQR